MTAGMSYKLRYRQQTRAQIRTLLSSKGQYLGRIYIKNLPCQKKCCNNNNNNNNNFDNPLTSRRTDGGKNKRLGSFLWHPQMPRRWKHNVRQFVWCMQQWVIFQLNQIFFPCQNKFVFLPPPKTRHQNTIGLCSKKMKQCSLTVEVDFSNIFQC